MRLARFAAPAFLALALLAAPLAAEAQPTGKVYRIAVVHPSQSVADMTEAKVRTSGRSLRSCAGSVTSRGRTSSWSGDRPRGVPHASPARPRGGPAPARLDFRDSGRMARAFQAATTTIPTVGITPDPIFEKLVASLARPGGNLTGFSSEAGEELIGKNVEILKEAVPRASRVALLTPQALWETPYGLAIRRAGARVGMTVIGALLSDPIQEPEFRRAFAAMVRDRVDTLLVADSPENFTHRQLIVTLAAQARLPAIYPFRDFADIGGLMAYSVDIVAMFRGAAGYVDRIFKGANPGDLPYQLPTKSHW